MTWTFMPRYKHWEWRVGHLLLHVSDAGTDPDEGPWWNWNIQNRVDDDVVADERYELDAGGAKTEAEAKAACIAAAAGALEDMLEKLKIGRRAATDFVPGRTVKDIATGRTWYPLVHVYTIDNIQSWLASEQDPSGEGLRMPADVKYIEISVDAT